jgi:hypothetical protein
MKLKFGNRKGEAQRSKVQAGLGAACDEEAVLDKSLFGRRRSAEL